MSAQHTPGPWCVSNIGLTNDGQRPVTSANRRIALIDAVVVLPPKNMWRSECAEREANALLIAAAPDLLAAMEQLSESPMFMAIEGHSAATAAIAKARGQS
jgi:hypothetical protein